jgi:hypothetical protein
MALQGQIYPTPVTLLLCIGIQRYLCAHVALYGALKSHVTVSEVSAFASMFFWMRTSCVRAHLRFGHLQCLKMTTTVFSYGSNSTVQLQARVQNPALQALPAKLENWERIFCVRTATWGGAAASLIPKTNGVVFGSAARLSDVELARLDNFEGGYHKEQVEISLWVENAWAAETATVYIANSLYWTVPPSEAYLTAIHVNLREQFGETMPVCANHIDTYGVFSKSGNGNVSTCRSGSAISHACGPTHAAAAADSGESDDFHILAATRGSDVLIEHISSWTYPGSELLQLPALCVEVNARRKVKWVMPRAIPCVMKELETVGVRSSAQLAVALCRGLKVDLEYVDTEALGLFRTLLKVD